MRYPIVLLLLLCACVARPFGDEPDDPTGDDPTDGETTSADDATSDVTTSATTIGTTIPTATATVTTGDTPTPGFDGDIQPIFDERCVTACHEPDGEWGFLLDLSDNAYVAIVGVPAPQFASMSLIEPGEPGASYLWHKISNTQASIGGSGLSMPKARVGMTATMLTQEQLATIEQWILDGAPQ